jgi:NADH-quinone oxidoreductase subunit K
LSGVPLYAYLVLGMILFGIGAVGVIIRRNPIVVFMCVELMLNAVNLTFLAFARYIPSMLVLNSHDMMRSALTGQMMVIFVMAVAAAEVAVGLGIIMAIYRLRDNLDVDDMSVLRG